MPRTMGNTRLSVARATVVLTVMTPLRPWKTRWAIGSEKEENTMHVSTRKLSMISALCFVAAALVCLSTGQTYAEPITIVNNLDQPLIFKEIKNRQNIQIKSDPPAEILAHASGQFKVEGGSTPTELKSVHLNIKYTIKDTADQVGIVYKFVYPGPEHCPKEHPDWVAETVEHCGNWDKGWKYTFAPQ